MIKRIILAGIGCIFLFLLFLFGKTTIPKSRFCNARTSCSYSSISLLLLLKQKQHLTPSQLIYVSKIENGISRGDVKNQSDRQLTVLADFWKDSVGIFPPYAYYLSEAAKLDNSEKNLTFAARLILENMKREDSVELKSWEAETAASLFERALKLDPDNDDLKVGLGSCYVYGQGNDWRSAADHERNSTVAGSCA